MDLTVLAWSSVQAFVLLMLTHLLLTRYQVVVYKDAKKILG